MSDEDSEIHWITQTVNVRDLKSQNKQHFSSHVHSMERLGKAKGK